MTQRLTVEAGIVTCPFRGDISPETCAACPESRGTVTYRGHEAVVCRAASRWFPPQLVSGW